MNRTEKALWKRVRGVFPGVAERMENAAIPGYPDVQGDWCGRAYWVELKASRTKAMPEARRVTDMLEPSQRLWLRRHLPHGALAFVLLGWKNGVALYLAMLVQDGRDFILEKRVSVENSLTKDKKKMLADSIKKEIYFNV